MVPRATRVLTAFGVVVGALTLTVATQLTAPELDFLASNFAHSVPRRQVIGLTLGAFAAAFLTGALLVLRRRERGLDALDWLVRLLCPLALTPLLVALTRRGFGTEAEAAILLSLFVLGFERLLRVSFAAWDERSKPAAAQAHSRWQRLGARVASAFGWYFARPRAVLATVVVLGIAHTVFMSIWAIWAHQRFFTFGYDLGQYDQLFATTLAGRWMAAPSQGNPQNWGDLAGSHADFIIFPLLPFYALHPRATTLMVLQAAHLGLAAVPVYLFARRWIATHWALVLAIAWLGYAPLHTSQLYDVHTQPFGAAWVVCAIAAVEYRRWVLYWLCFALALSCREDVPMGMAMLGVFLAFTGYRFRTGVATAALSAVYFFVIRFLVMQSSGFASLYSDLVAPGEGGFGAIIQTLISNPVYAAKTLVSLEKVRFFCQIMAPLVFLPVRHWALWILFVAASILTVVTTGYAPTISISFQYVSNWAAYAFPAAAVAVALFGQTAHGLVRQRAAMVTVLCATVLTNLQWGAYSPAASLKGGFHEVPFLAPSEADLQRARDLETVLKQVPKETSVCTSDRIQAHTTYHLHNWSLKDGTFECDYLLWSDLPGDLGASRVGPAIAEGKYERVASLGGISLAKKVVKPPQP